MALFKRITLICNTRIYLECHPSGKEALEDGSSALAPFCTINRCSDMHETPSSYTLEHDV